MVNVKRRPSLKAVPRNVRVAESVAAKARTKKGLEEGKKCPVCGMLCKYLFVVVILLLVYV